MLNAGSSSTPQDLASVASAGTGPDYSFADHKHKMPSASDVGAIATTAKGAASGVASLDSNTRLTSTQMPAITGDVSIQAGTTTANVDKIKGKSVATPTVSGSIAQYDGTNIVWGSIPSGGSGGGGVTLFFNNGTTAQAPLGGLPTLINGATYKELRKVAETNQTTFTSSVLTSSYTNVLGFVTDVDDPATTEISAGLWDFNLWANSNDANTTIKAELYRYRGSLSQTSLLASSSAVNVGLAVSQLVFSFIIPQTTILETDRICIVILATNPNNSHTVSLKFGGSTPSHIHTTIPSVGGSGVVKVVNGVTQDSASKIVDADVSDTAAIAQSKINGLTTSLSALASNSITISTGTGLAGGGNLTANRTLSVNFGTTDNTACIGNDSRLSDSRAPSGTAGGDLEGTYPNPSLKNVTTAQTNIGSSSSVPIISVDAKGRITSLSSAAISVSGGVSSFSGGTTGLTPNTASTGAVALAGTLNVSNGGTGATTQEEARGVMGGIQTATVRYTTNITPAVAGTMTGAVWTTGSAIVTFTSANVTLLPGMSLNGSGLTANVIKTVDSATQVTMSANSTGSGSSSLTVYNSTLTTMVTGSAPSMDGRTVIAGDVILLTSQNVTATGGPWKVVSNSGSALTLTRPTWFQGVLTQPILIGLQLGSSGGGFVYTVGPNFGALGAISIGLDSLVLALTSSRAANAVTGTNLFTSYQTFRANGTSANSCPFFFQGSAGLMTTPQAHAVEWDSTSLYVTPMNAVVTGGTGGVSSTSLVVASVTSGFISVGCVISGTGITAGTTITAGPPTGGAGTYTMSSANTVSTGTGITCATRRRVGYAEDSWTINSAAGIVSASTINFDADIQDCMFYTVASLGNWTLNIRASASTNLNSVLSIGQSRTIVFMATNGTTAYKLSGVNVDGATQTIKWLGGTAPAAGSVSAIDSYSITVIKTGPALFTVLASLVTFS